MTATGWGWNAKATARLITNARTTLGRDEFNASGFNCVKTPPAPYPRIPCPAG
jgi:hypothetical protein